MTKTISISDDVYEMLVKIKGKRSFYEVIRELVKKEGNMLNKYMMQIRLVEEL